MTSKLDAEERKALLGALEDSGWRAAEEGDAMSKRLIFKDFSAAWGFMSRAALCAETMNHHPDWRNVYNKLEITLSTHDCGGVSVLDIELARALDALAEGVAEVDRDIGRPLMRLADHVED
ncbi:MAG: 4a-hydroxytetrahydrobiopterin dehydratase [Thioclava sp.]|jgi:pterin-4-alpha-carbinolamine dehydratase (EC 4.2.1.96)|nr:4a-hydroxytetrahydrobiopterin dehydratase [Thioclava sp.]MBD3802177.1 4a-hydroxytetrahydrobiopterin dehydratase [Thioclava sp.]